jgi:deoxyribonuclease-4
VLIGAHVPTRGRGPAGAVQSARHVGADAIQLWGSNPRAWRPPAIRTGDVEAFREALRDSGVRAVFLHAPYMVNVASPDERFRARSVDLARATVAMAEALGTDGVVVHAGAAGAATEREVALHRAAASLTAVAARAERAFVLVELTAGTAGSVVATFPEARELFDACDRHERLALCADTCHLFAAGYALDTAEGVADCFAELRRAGLARTLRLVHANDSVHGKGEHRDAHTHIGRGRIGEVGFAAILAQPAVRRAAVICETPGRLEDTARNVATLRRLATRAVRAERAATP